MYDRQTESLWPQIEGRAVAGALTGTALTRVPAAVVSWDQWRSAHPTAWVLSRQTGSALAYGSNPYFRYDDKASLPLFLPGEIDNRIEWLKQPVVGIEVGGDALAVGTVAVFRPEVDGQRRTFRPDGGGIVDDQTGSTWDALGLATIGPSAGTRLEPQAHLSTFWFAWRAFHENTRVQR